MAVERVTELEGTMLSFLDEENDQQCFGSAPASEQSFRIRSMEQANWAVRKIARAEHMRQQCRDLVDQEMAKLNAWLSKQEEESDHERSFFERLLRDYLEEQKQTDSHLKSVKLPSGRVGLRKQQPEFQRDNQRLLAWLSINRPELVKVREEPDWAGVKAIATIGGDNLVDSQTGEIIAGVTVINRPEKLVVQLV